MQPRDHLPPFPQIGPLCGTDLGAILHKVPASKAPGRDGWTYQDLEVLPPEALTWLAEVFGLVEDLGVWPADVAHSFVAMLPKWGTGEADDFRPFVLLSVSYW